MITPKECEHLEKKAAEGDAKSIGKLAYAYNKGVGLERDLVKAREYYEMPAEREDRLAMLWPARYYKNGEGGLEKNYFKALELFEKCADHCDMWAITEIIELYNTGMEGFPKDEVLALIWLERANRVAGSGTDWTHQVAQYTLGCEYDSGRHIDADDEKALQWFLVSAENGHSGAMIQLAEAYYKGKGIEEDKDSAWLWLNKAVTLQGDQYFYSFLRQFNSNERDRVTIWYEEKMM